MRTAWVHIGLPKTGSTAFQNALFAKDWGFAVPEPVATSEPKHEPIVAAILSQVDGLFDVDRPPPGLGGGAALDPTEFLWRHLPEHWGADEIAQVNHRFDQLLASSKDMIISAEELFHVPALAGPLVDRLAPAFDRVRVLVVLRDLSEWIPSQLGQLCQSESPEFDDLVRAGLDLGDLYPAFRLRLGPWVKRLGPENIVAMPYRAPDEAPLLERMFGRLLGAAPVFPGQLRRNVSGSGKLIAVMLAMRLTGLGGAPGLSRAARMLLSVGGDFGSGALTLTPERMGQIVAENHADLEWLESRLGSSLRHPPRNPGLPVDSILGLAETGARLMPDFARHVATKLSLDLPAGRDGPSLPALAEHLAGLKTLPAVPADFDGAHYLRLQPDVAAARMDPAEHYRHHGFFEGRRY